MSFAKYLIGIFAGKCKWHLPKEFVFGLLEVGEN